MTKTVAITGASSGIGEALAWEFAARGYNLIVMARREDRLAALTAKIQDKYPQVTAVAVSCDVAELDSIYPALEQGQSLAGGLDMVVANAGIAGVQRTGVDDFSKCQRVIQVNLLGGMATVDAAARLFRSQGRPGTIVGVSSVAAYKGLPGSGAYSASKAGFSNFLDATRMELKRHGIKVISVHPGFIKTDLAPNMEKYPFVIEADKAAQEMVNGVEKGSSNIIVPAMPWKVLGRVTPLLPDDIYTKLF